MANLHIVPRKGRNLSTDAQQELYFPAVQYAGVIDTEELARAISQRTSLSTGDVKNVLDALSVELQRDLALSYKVQLDGVAHSVPRSRGSADPRRRNCLPPMWKRLVCTISPTRRLCSSSEPPQRKWWEGLQRSRLPLRRRRRLHNLVPGMTAARMHCHP